MIISERGRERERETKEWDETLALEVVCREAGDKRLRSFSQSSGNKHAWTAASDDDDDDDGRDSESECVDNRNPAIDGRRGAGVSIGEDGDEDKDEGIDDEEGDNE